MHVLTWAEIILGVSLLLALGALSVLEDLLEYVLHEAPLPSELDADIVGTKHRYRR
jgi:hypothetical protein